VRSIDVGVRKPDRQLEKISLQVLYPPHRECVAAVGMMAATETFCNKAALAEIVEKCVSYTD
jgi:hypothetical protein